VPKKLTPEEEASRIRYSSVTLPKDFLLFLDKLVFLAGKEETFTERGNHLPSRRAIVQDAIEMYIEELAPEIVKEYRQMLEDCNMYRPLEFRLKHKRKERA
jgi:hypothetical protein